MASDGCGSMALLREAALGRGVNHFFVPPWSPEDNPVEGVVNHFKSDVATVLLSACAVGGALDESFVGYASELFVGCTSGSRTHDAVITGRPARGTTTSTQVQGCTELCRSGRPGEHMSVQRFGQRGAHRSMSGLNR